MKALGLQPVSHCMPKASDNPEIHCASNLVASLETFFQSAFQKSFKASSSCVVTTQIKWRKTSKPAWSRLYGKNSGVFDCSWFLLQLLFHFLGFFPKTYDPDQRGEITEDLSFLWLILTLLQGLLCAPSPCDSSWFSESISFTLNILKELLKYCHTIFQGSNLQRICTLYDKYSKKSLFRSSHWC